MRMEGWPHALNEYVESRRHLPFEWGTHDCILFACGAIEAITGNNPAPEVTWNDARSALVALAALGGIEQAITDVLGSPVPILCAQRGDLVLSDNGAAGVCLGVQCVWVEESGLAFFALDKAVRAWRVE